RRDLHGYAPRPTLEVSGHRDPQEPCSGEPDDHEVTVLAAERCCEVELVEPDVTAGVQPAQEPLEVRPAQPIVGDSRAERLGTGEHGPGEGRGESCGPTDHDASMR